MKTMKTINTQARTARTRLTLGLLGLAAGTALAAPASQAAPSKTDAALTQQMAAHAKTGWTDVIVTTGGALTPAQEARLKALGADITRRLPIVKATAVHMPSRSLGELAALPFVTHLSYDGAVKKCDEFTVASSGAGQAFQQYGLTGKGVTVAVVDSGMQNSHPDLTRADGSSCIKANQNFVTYSDNWHSVYSDYCGHGSHVAGIIAGDGTASTGFLCTHTFYGIARNANLVNVRVLDDTGGGTVSTVVAGIQWVVSNQAKYGIKVMNLSLGHPVGESYKTDPLCQAVEAAWKAGIVVVCAAGNEGRASDTNKAGADNEGWGTAYGSINSPGNDPYVITVGATKFVDGTRAHDKIATYSSRGPSRLDLILKPDIIAPGNHVVSLDVSYSQLNGAYGGTNLLPYSAYSKVKGVSNQDGAGMSNEYFVLSGTSMATPVVAGAAALLLEKYPTLSPDTIKARLMVSADKWASPTGQYDPLTYGAGYLDIPAALASNVTLSQSALSPALSVDANGNADIISGTSVVWGKNVIWGKDISSLMGSSVVWGTSVVWGKSVIWGTSVASPNGAVASSSVVWGKSVWSDTSKQPISESSVDLSSVAVNGE